MIAATESKEKTNYILEYSLEKDKFVVKRLNEMLADNIINVASGQIDDYKVICVSSNYELICRYAETFRNTLNSLKK